MFKSNKSETERRFELLTLGLALVTMAVCYVIFRDVLPAVILFFPGLVVFGSAIFQDMQPDWQAGYPTYIISGLAIAIGLAGILNTFFGPGLPLGKQLWLVFAIVELGALFVAKALYDPNL